MIDTKTRQDLPAAVDKARSKAADTIDAAKDSVERARDGATSTASATLDDGKDTVLAGASALSKAGQDKASEYREAWVATDPVGKAKDFAVSVKSHASDALTGLGKVVADNAALASDKLGDKYGDVARSAARSIQETAAKLETGDLDDLGDSVKTFVRKNPALTLGVAAVAGYLVYRSLKKAPKAEAVEAD